MKTFMSQLVYLIALFIAIAFQSHVQAAPAPAPELILSAQVRKTGLDASLLQPCANGSQRDCDSLFMRKLSEPQRQAIGGLSFGTSAGGGPQTALSPAKALRIINALNDLI